MTVNADVETEQAGPDPKTSIETWEMSTGGTVWVHVTDPRTGGYVKIRVGGNSGQRRLRISVDDRRYNEEQVLDTVREGNPFTNGMLVLRSKTLFEADIDRSAHLTGEELQEILDFRDETVFEEAVKDFPHELTLRRLKALADEKGTRSQIEILDDVLRERYPIGGTQPTVQEILDEEERSRGTRLS